jgi:hypothetical protein
LEFLYRINKINCRTNENVGIAWGRLRVVDRKKWNLPGGGWEWWIEWDFSKNKFSMAKNILKFAILSGEVWSGGQNELPCTSLPWHVYSYKKPKKRCHGMYIYLIQIKMPWQKHLKSLPWYVYRCSRNLRWHGKRHLEFCHGNYI